MFDDQGRLQYEFGRQISNRKPTNSELEARAANWRRRIADGTNLDTIALMKRELQERLPHFGYTGLGFDGEHRLWVIGKIHDSTFVDTFADSNFLGRRMIDCILGRASAVRGQWLALTCLNDDDIERPVVIRLFRIVDD